MKKFVQLMDPTDDVAAFAKAFNQMCAATELKGDENTWAVFQKRDMLQDKMLLHK